LISSGEEVRVAPVNAELVEPDDIVLVRVAGNVYLHRVLAVDKTRRRARIGNNRGGINGWAGFARVYGICVEVGGRARPNLGSKVVGAPPTS
jgi:hypothetical protein